MSPFHSKDLRFRFGGNIHPGPSERDDVANGLPHEPLEKVKKAVKAGTIEEDTRVT
jgi:hypothetical protein